MRKNISFTIAAAIMGLAMVFWVKASCGRNQCRRCNALLAFTHVKFELFTDQDFVGPFVQRMARGSRKAHDAGGFRKCERIAGMGRPAHCGKGAQKGSCGARGLK